MILYYCGCKMILYYRGACHYQLFKMMYLLSKWIPFPPSPRAQRIRNYIIPSGA
nr:hypothetical protein Q903MT_gene1450 [Picea sitchensis]